MLVRDIEKALVEAERNGYKESNATICKAALVHLLRKAVEAKHYRALILGGGGAALVFHFVKKLQLLNLNVTVAEHNVSYYEQIVAALGAETNIKVQLQELSILPDNMWQIILDDWHNAANYWETHALQLPETVYHYEELHNVFYRNIQTIVDDVQPSINMLIIAGPSGNGRLLALPLLAARLSEDALILIDDFIRLPFLEQAEKQFTYIEHHREVRGEQCWVLIQLTGRKNDGLQIK